MSNFCLAVSTDLIYTIRSTCEQIPLVSCSSERREWTKNVGFLSSKRSNAECWIVGFVVRELWVVCSRSWPLFFWRPDDGALSSKLMWIRRGLSQHNFVCGILIIIYRWRLLVTPYSAESHLPSDSYWEGWRLLHCFLARTQRRLLTVVHRCRPGWITVEVNFGCPNIGILKPRFLPWSPRSASFFNVASWSKRPGRRVCFVQGFYSGWIVGRPGPLHVYP